MGIVDSVTWGVVEGKHLVATDLESQSHKSMLSQDGVDVSTSVSHVTVHFGSHLLSRSPCVAFIRLSFSWIMVRGANERVPVDFRTFRSDRNDGTTWQVGVSHCALFHIYGSQTYRPTMTRNTFVDKPCHGLNVFKCQHGSGPQDALNYVGQKVTLKGMI
jgi:hypothetical protein